MMARGLYRGKGRVRPYSRIFERGAVGSINELDGRTREARLMRKLEAELLAHLGGNPTIVQAVDRADLQDAPTACDVRRKDRRR